MEYNILLTTRDRRRQFAAIIEMCCRALYEYGQLTECYSSGEMTDECRSVLCVRNRTEECVEVVEGGLRRCTCPGRWGHNTCRPVTSCLTFKQTALVSATLTQLPLFILVLMKYNSEHQAPLSDRQTVCCHLFPLSINRTLLVQHLLNSQATLIIPQLSLLKS